MRADVKIWAWLITLASAEAKCLQEKNWRVKIILFAFREYMKKFLLKNNLVEENKSFQVKRFRSCNSFIY